MEPRLGAFFTGCAKKWLLLPVQQEQSPCFEVLSSSLGWRLRRSVVEPALCSCALSPLKSGWWQDCSPRLGGSPRALFFLLKIVRFVCIPKHLLASETWTCALSSPMRVVGAKQELEHPPCTCKEPSKWELGRHTQWEGGAAARIWV